MICPNCQSDNRDGAKFCNECGLPLSGRIAQVAAAAAAEEAAQVTENESGEPQDSAAIEDVESVEGDLAPFVPHPREEKPLATTADLSGFDECLVDASYVAPQSSWSSGSTMELPRIETTEVPKQKDFRAPDPHEKGSGKGKAIAIVVTCLLVAGCMVAGATYCLELWGGKMLPDVVGMTQADAASQLEEKGFSVQVAKENSDEAEGLVLSMEPGAGARQGEGTTVTIVVSQARTMPDLTGIQRDEAAALLEQGGFANVSFVAEKSDDDEGKVLGIDPEPGAKVKADTPITITVASPYVVPDVAGKTWDEASAVLADEGYEAVATYVYDETVDAGAVLGTDPAAGEKLTSGSAVTVSIALSRAKELEQAAWGYLSGGQVVIADTSYQVDSVDAVSYAGADSTAFTITARAVTTLAGETVYGSSKQISGTIVWNGDNTIASIS